jgi:methionyl-tRNA synthetase
LTTRPHILGTKDFDINDISEPLATRIYTFIQNEFNGRVTLTTKETEEKEKAEIEVNQPESVQAEETDEKKQYPKESRKLKTVAQEVLT